MKNQPYVDALGVLALPASGTVYSRARPVRARISLAAVWTGTPTGVFKVQVSFDNGTTWFDWQTLSPLPAGGASSAAWPTIVDAGGGIWRVAYTGTSGTGSATLSYSLMDVTQQSSGGGSGGGTWSATPFSASVVFDGNKTMPQQTVSSVIAFTPNAAGRVAGGANNVRLIADGANVPTFAGFVESGASMGYDNRAGVTNEVFFRFDGYEYKYAVLQDANPVIASSALRFAALAYAAESGSAGAGYVYTSTTGTGTGCGGPNVTRPVSGNASFTAVVGAFTGNGPAIGWTDTSAIATAYNDTHFVYGLMCISGSYVPLHAGTLPTRNGATVAGATSDIMRLRISGTSQFCEVSKDSGSSWTIVHTYTGVPTSQLWPGVEFTGSAVCGPLFYTGLT